MAEQEIEYLGVVKWFGNRQTDEQYGFIYQPDLGDIFVHAGRTLSAIEGNDIVSFKIKESQKLKGKYEAYEVKKIGDEISLKQLLEYYLYKNIEFNYKVIFHEKIFKSSNKTELFLNETTRKYLDTFIEQRLLSYLETNKVDSNDVSDIYKCIKELFSLKLTSGLSYSISSTNPNMVKYFTESTNDKVRFIGWLNNLNANCTIDIIERVFKISDHHLQRNIFIYSNIERCKSLSDLYVSCFMEEVPRKNHNNYANKYEFLSVTKFQIEELRKELQKKDDQLSKTFLIKIFPKCSTNLKLELWLRWSWLEFSEDISDLIINRFKDFDNTYSQQILNNIITSEDEKFETFIKKLTSHDLNSIYGNNFRELLSRLKNIPVKAKYYTQLIEVLPSTKRLELWAEDELEKLDIDIITDAFPHLSTYYKEITLKKILYYYTEKTKDRIEVFINKSLMSFKESGNDFEIFITLKLIDSKIKGEEIKLKQFITHFLQLLHNKIKIDSWGITSDSLFENCTGRTLYDKSDDSIYKSNVIPEGVKLCEGRKAINKSTNEFVLENDRQFYWCKNKPCYQNEINLKEPENWKDYRLFNILRKIDKSLTEDNYTFQLGILNKFYRYIEHLKCRVCNYWLSPIVQTNFAFDRVNKFSCINENCSENHKEIYISHCLNPRCNNIVDNRDSKQCKHNWYICSYCLSCCASEKIEIRKEIRSKTGQGYNGPEKGHDELGQIFCHKCGNEINIIQTQVDKEKIEEYYNLFGEITGIKDFSFGIKKNDKKWIFIKVSFYQSFNELYIKLKPFEEIGFQVTKNDSATGLFIAEPDSDSIISLKCSNSVCDFYLNLTALFYSDKEKTNALKFHKKIKSLLENKN